MRPGARIATQTEAIALKHEFNSLPKSDRARFDYDPGVYIASKGYDGAKWEEGADAYCTLYNKSALVFFSEVTGV